MTSYFVKIQRMTTKYSQLYDEEADGERVIINLIRQLNDQINRNLT